MSQTSKFERITTILRETATTCMRWFRPIVFVLLTFFFVVGYWWPEQAVVWLEMAEKTPEWLATIITAMIVGIAAEKGIREIGEAIRTLKDQLP
ncbi:hypothetical protein vBCbaSRXM_82 [Citromicrobium phage vB_CbaS-RXM]|nr:hypothetical protein vBCbaSRXM_82 [Citromicrobium phage vB_CbaS-RXM]